MRRSEARRQAVGWSQERLAGLAGTTQQTIDRIERGLFKRTPSALPKIAHALGVNLYDLDPSLGQGVPRASGGRVDDRTEFGLPNHGPRDLPVYAAAEGGQGTVIVTTEAVDWVRRPAPLATAKGGYAILVVGESMVPRYRPGDTLLVNPHIPARREDGVVLYAGEVSGDVRATVKEFVRSTEKHWVVRRYLPETEIKLLKTEWPIIHVVVGAYSRR